MARRDDADLQPVVVATAGMRAPRGIASPARPSGKRFLAIKTFVMRAQRLPGATRRAQHQRLLALGCACDGGLRSSPDMCDTGRQQGVGADSLPMSCSRPPRKTFCLAGREPHLVGDLDARGRRRVARMTGQRASRSSTAGGRPLIDVMKLVSPSCALRTSTVRSITFWFEVGVEILEFSFCCAVSVSSRCLSFKRLLRSMPGAPSAGCRCRPRAC